MDPNDHVPPRTGEGIRGSPEQAGASNTTESASTRDGRRWSPSPAREGYHTRSLSRDGAASILSGPQTPSALDDNGDTYFGSFPQVQTTRSRASTRSINRPETLRSSSGYGGAQDSMTGERTRPSQGTRQPSIRIRRISNASVRRTTSRDSSISDFPTQHEISSGRGAESSQGGRPRSMSQPERASLPQNTMHSRRVPQIALPRLTEEGIRPSLDELGITSPVLSLPDDTRSVPDAGDSSSGPWAKRMFQKGGKILWPGRRKASITDHEDVAPIAPSNTHQDVYDAQLVDYLDTIDPEVQTLSTLTNVQNSLFVPDLGPWLNRRPTYTLTQHASSNVAISRPPTATDGQQLSKVTEDHEMEEQTGEMEDRPADELHRMTTITSQLTESRYATVPHGETLEGWSPEEKWELDDHVRHMLHSRRSKFKQTMKGFGQYVRRPLGFFVTLYATLITLFGLAWVLFLIGWIYVGPKQDYTIHIIDSVLVALFAIMGDGLAPFRAVDTYHLIFIVRYTRIIKKWEEGRLHRAKLQKKSIPEDVRASYEEAALSRAVTTEQRRSQLLEAIPAAGDEEDVTYRTVPIGMQETDTDPLDGRPIMRDMAEVRKLKTEEFPLTPKQAARLEHHRNKLAKSHSFYKPDETFTHNPFPQDLLIAIIILLDCHSCLQISLGATTWGINYHHRNAAITTVILCVSITCNITAGLVISIGDRKTRKKDIHELMSRQELTSEAMKHIEKKKKKDQDSDEAHKKMQKTESNDTSASSKLKKFLKNKADT